MTVAGSVIGLGITGRKPTRIIGTPAEETRL